MDRTDAFEVERPRLLRLATRVLGERSEAEDVVQQAWLRLHRTDTGIESLPAWLTTVTTRLCLDRLTPSQRVALVLHESFGVDFEAIAAILSTTPVAARKLASRARAKIGQPSAQARTADGEIVDAFMAAARGGDFLRLLQLLAPDAEITADAAAVLAGTPERIEGRRDVANFFDGSAHAALSVFVGDRPGAAWFHRGRAMVAFDFMITDGTVSGIMFRSAPEALLQVTRGDGGADRHPDRSTARLQHEEGERP